MSDLSLKDSQCRWPLDQDSPLCLEHTKPVGCCTHAAAALQARLQECVSRGEMWVRECHDAESRLSRAEQAVGRLREALVQIRDGVPPIDPPYDPRQGRAEQYERGREEGAMWAYEIAKAALAEAGEGGKAGA